MAYGKGRKRKEGEWEDEGEGISVRGNQILPVAILPSNFDGTPLDGAQYLAVVRQEASAAPAIIRSALYDGMDVEASSSSLSGSKRVKSFNDGPRHQDVKSQLPSLEWQSAFLSRFRNMRESLSNRPKADGGLSIGLPQVVNARKWFRFIYHVNPIKKLGHDEQDGEERTSSSLPIPRSATVPSTAILRHFHTAQILALLQALHTWMEEGWRARDEDPSDDAERSSALDPLHSQWIFALLAHLDDRLVGDDISTLRILARTCIAQIGRVRLVDKQDTFAERQLCQVDFDKEQGAWIVICAIAGIWAQFDLWEDASSSLNVGVSG